MYIRDRRKRQKNHVCNLIFLFKTKCGKSEMPRISRYISQKT